MKYLENEWTLANNRKGEGFMEERLDRFFDSPEWIYQCPSDVVHHVQKQSSDHSLPMLDDMLSKQHTTRRFYFDRRFMKVSDFEKVGTGAWKVQ